MLKTTETLLEKLARNDQNRWARFYGDYVPWIERTLCAKLPLSREDSEEIVHDTLVELVRAMPNYKKRGAFHSFLFKIAQNKAIDRLRKDARYAARLEKFAQEPLEPSPQEFQNETFLAALRRVMADDSISGIVKIAFRRYAQEGEDARKVAEDLGMDVNAVYQIKNRLKAKIKAEMERLRIEYE
ncbi:MAG: RNA polymerase sigma factor [Kiritimatiellae bacterium]|nr:RNA polymerase sigma factor [Kiritimatiellia bacterium]